MTKLQKGRESYYLQAFVFFLTLLQWLYRPPPAVPPKFRGVIKQTYKDSSHGGRLASCDQRALPTCFSS